jgi:homoserine kinase
MKITMNEDISRRILEKSTGQAVYRIVKARAPSSAANLGPGFDVFGMALALFYDTIEIELVSAHGLTVTVEGIDAERVSTVVEKNTAGLVAGMIMEAMNRREGLKIRLTKGVPIGGLGSSAASAAACVRAVDEMFGLRMDSKDLVELAAQGENVSAGVAHFDNVAAAVMGGFVLISQDPLCIAQFVPPKTLEVAVAIPRIDIPDEKTKVMRHLLPKTVDFASATHNVAHASLLVAGMALSDIDMIGKAMSDSIVEPIRSRSIPIFDFVKKAAFASGASGFAISGAGPTVIALCDKNKTLARDVAHAMKETFQNGGVSCEAYSTTPSSGASIVEKR